VKKLIKPSVTSAEDESKLSRIKPVSTASTSAVANGSEVKSEVESQSYNDEEKFRKACRTIQSLFEQMKALKEQDVEKTVSFICL
jgi:hypothetical protein